MNLVALDLSLRNTGYATTAGHVGTIPAGDLRGPHRLSSILRNIIRLVDTADLVVIEDYAFSRANQAHQIGELHGVVMLWLYEQRVPTVRPSTTALKKYATGKGNASKEDVLVAAVKRLDYDGSSPDEADALWLLEMARDALLDGWEPRVPESHRSALAAVPWPKPASTGRSPTGSTP